MAKSKIPTACKTFAKLPQDSSFVKLITALQHVLHVGRLAKKLKKWFDETQGRQSDLQYRFTGKESRAFCHHFSTLFALLKLPSDSKKQTQKILALHYVGLRLRDCSFMNRYDIEQADIDKLTVLAREYYRANALFQLPTSVIIPLSGQFGMWYPCMLSKYMTNTNMAYLLLQWKAENPNI